MKFTSEINNGVATIYETVDDVTKPIIYFDGWSTEEEAQSFIDDQIAMLELQNEPEVLEPEILDPAEPEPTE